MKKVRWGIIAPGNIAHKFAEALAGTERAQLYSVASRSIDKARAFADQYSFEKVAEDYQALINDPNVDVIYIASPHTLHAEQSIACLNAGKAVLCEKPMTVNADDADRVIQVARDNKVFYMEAVWARFIPIYKQVREWLDSGAIGEVKMLQASFGFFRECDPDNRLYDHQLAGGATLDVGIYTITFAQWVMRTMPMAIKALGQIGHTNVDEHSGVLMQYPNGEIAVLNSAIVTNTNHEAWIFGTKGKIKIHPQFWHSEQATLMIDGHAEQTVTTKHRINGYEGEVEEVHQCLDQGLLESPSMTWQESLNVMNIMDEIRTQLGLVYSFER